MAALTIRGIRTITTAPRPGLHLVVVKVETSEPGLYGLGCATFTQRHLAVCSAIDDYLGPLLIGRDPQRIEDNWQLMHVNSYWRNGPVLNNAISGVDMALWDLKGKVAGLPLYELFGGKCREAAAVYRHTDGRAPEEVAERVRAAMEEGFQYIRCQLGGYGGLAPARRSPDGAQPGAYFDPEGYARSVPKLFDYVRSRVGDEIELLHDVHERLTPINAVRLAKSLEQYRLFFLEDPLPPEQISWFQMLRTQCSTPIAMGELLVNSAEWLPLVSNGLIDFIRVHISSIGGLTPARKLAVLCEAFGVRTAWHGPADVSPIGQAANLHLDLSCPNFGVQEFQALTEAELAIFPGSPQVRDGYMYPNDRPGLGVDLDEKEAARYPCSADLITWTQARTPDGTVTFP